MTEEKTLLSSKLGGGPQGLGDPTDQSLRKVERDVLIAKRIREVSRIEKCPKEVEAFENCCRDKWFSMVYKCRPETKIMKECLASWYGNEELRKRCTKEYLSDRTFFRETGISRAKVKELRGQNNAA